MTEDGSLAFYLHVFLFCLSGGRIQNGNPGITLLIDYLHGCQGRVQRFRVCPYGWYVPVLFVRLGTARICGPTAAVVDDDDG